MLDARQCAIGISILLSLALSLGAQNGAPTDPVRSACGPNNVRMQVHVSKAKIETPMESGKARVFVIGVFRKPSFEFFLDPTILIGMDGSWVGAARNRSYLSLSVMPGDHHLCAEWNSTLQKRPPSLSRLHAQPGKDYYFRARIMYPGGLDFVQLDPDEGRLLVSRSQFVTASPN